MQCLFASARTIKFDGDRGRLNSRRFELFECPSFKVQSSASFPAGSMGRQARRVRRAVLGVQPRAQARGPQARGHVPPSAQVPRGRRLKRREGPLGPAIVHLQRYTHLGRRKPGLKIKYRNEFTQRRMAEQRKPRTKESATDDRT